MKSARRLGNTKQNQAVRSSRKSIFAKNQAAREHAKKSMPGAFTPQKRAAFLEHYAKGGTVRTASKAVGISAVTVFRTARLDAEFSKRLETARETNTDQVEDGLHHLAVAGNITAMFGILRARRPNVWRENSTVRVDAGDGFAAAFAQAMKQSQEGAPLGIAPATDRPGQPVH